MPEVFPDALDGKQHVLGWTDCLSRSSHGADLELRSLSELHKDVLDFSVEGQRVHTKLAPQP
jgi:hypothetical protein